jgi:ribosomal silencing factor RsfS
MASPTELQKLFKKYSITAKKHEGDDAGSWAVFHKGQVIVSGLTRPEVTYYKRQVLESVQKRGKK